MEVLAPSGLATGGPVEGRVGPRFRGVFLQERDCGLIGRMPSVCAPVWMALPVGKIHPLDGAGDLAGRSGGVGDVGEVVRGGSTSTLPGQQPQRPQLVVGEPTGQQLLLGDRRILQGFMKPGHRSGEDRRGLGDPPDVEDHRRAVSFERPPQCALGDSSGAFDSHARCRHFVKRGPVTANRPDALLAAFFCRHSIADTPNRGPRRLAPFSAISPSENLIPALMLQAAWAPPGHRAAGGNPSGRYGLGRPYLPSGDLDVSSAPCG
jgi:hypothetical protein